MQRNVRRGFVQRPFILLLGASTGIVNFLASTAWACSLPCEGAGPFPSAGSVPANAVQFLVGPSRSFGSDGGYDPSSLRVFEASGDGGATEVEVELVAEELGEGIRRFTPAEPIAAGTELRVEHTQTACSTRSTSSTVSVVAAAPAPTELGMLETEVSEGSLFLTDYSVGCGSSYHSAYADLNVVLSSSAMPYADVLRYSILVDGEPFDQSAFDYSETEEWLPLSLGGSPLGRGTGRIYAICEQAYPDFHPQSLTPGKHRVQMVAHLPDGTSLATEEHAVTLAFTQCPPTDSLDSGSTTAGKSGCSIAATPAGAASAGWLWMVATGAIWAGRRSRRSMLNRELGN